MPDSDASARQLNLVLFGLRCLQRLPLSWAVALGGAVGGLLARLPLGWGSARRVVLVNTLLCFPHLTYREAEAQARQALTETGRTLAEFAHVWTRPVQETLARVTSVVGLDALRAAREAGEPILLLTLHQSSWEIPNLVLGPEVPMTVFYQSSSNSAFNDLVTRAREATGSRLVTADARGVKAGLAALSRREAVAILVDHTPHGGNNPDIPFFGHAVRTSNLTHKFVQRYRPRVFFVGCHRRRDVNDIQVYIEPAPEAVYSADEAEMLTAMNATLADLIRRHPTQYHWTYKRFRHAQGRKRRLYREDVLPFLAEARRRNGTLDMDRLP